MRGLLLLLVLVPLLPTVLMLRFMVEAVRGEQEAARIRLGEVYRQSLQTAGGSLPGHFGKERTSSAAGTPEGVLEYYRRTLDPEVNLQLVDKTGQHLAGDAVPPGAAPIAEARAGDALPGWRIQVHLRRRVLNEATEDQVRTYTRVIVGAFLANLLIATLAAIALHRRLRIHEMESSALATLAHELRTPVAATRVLVETLAQQIPPPKQQPPSTSQDRGRPRSPDADQVRDYLRLIGQENERLRRLLDNFLLLSQLDHEANGADRRETIDPALLARSAAERLESRFRETPGCRFEIRVEPALPPVLADREAIVAALANLLDNALKYTGGEKHIVLRVGRRRHRGGEHIDFEVTDNGIGIPAAEQPRIFERFYRVDQRLARTREGCGIGLSIVRGIAECHGGRRRARARGGAFAQAGFDRARPHAPEGQRLRNLPAPARRGRRDPHHHAHRADRGIRRRPWAEPRRG